MSDIAATCVFNGRLGNTMFQAAALVAYAKRHSLSWALPGGYLWCDIYRFGLPTTVDVIDRAVVKEPFYHYAPLPAPTGPRVALEGFFQSWRHFEDARDEVREAFRLPPVKPFDGVSVHVRRTDFVNRKHKLWNPLGLPYYANATRVFAALGQRRFAVFSDDLKWCQSELPKCNPQAQFTFCEEPDAVHAMARMAACAGHVIANSTLSWWAAWLGGKATVAPAHGDWFGEEMRHQDTRDLYPLGWVEVPTL